MSYVRIEIFHPKHGLSVGFRHGTDMSSIEVLDDCVYAGSFFRMYASLSDQNVKTVVPAEILKESVVTTIEVDDALYE